MKLLKYLHVTIVYFMCILFSRCAFYFIDKYHKLFDKYYKLCSELDIQFLDKE